MRTTNRKPQSVGEILASEYGMTPIKLMHKTGLSLCYADGVMSGRQQVGPRIAKTLAKSLGNSVEFWLGTELRSYLWEKEQRRTSPMCECGHRGRTHSLLPFRNGLAHVCRVSTCGCKNFTEQVDTRMKTTRPSFCEFTKASARAATREYFEPLQRSDRSLNVLKGKDK